MGQVTLYFATTDEQIDELEAFAKSIDHRISRRYPLIGIRNEQEIIGFAELMNTPVFMSGFKKGVGKDSVKAMKTLIQEQKNEYGECWAFVPPTSPMYKHMKKLSFCNTTLTAFRAS